MDVTKDSSIQHIFYSWYQNLKNYNHDQSLGEAHELG